VGDGWNSISNLFSSAFTRPAESRTFIWIDPSRADGVGGDLIPANEAYVSVTLARMMLKHSGVLWKEFYPVVHSFIELSREDANEVIIPFVSSSAMPQLTENGGRVIQQNIDLLKSTPYIGGNLNVGVGLFAAQSADYLKNLLDVLGSFSKVVGGTTISGALNVVEPLKDGVESLLGISGKINFKLGSINGFKPSESSPPISNPDEHRLIDGYYAAINVAEGTYSAHDLSFQDGVLRHPDSDGTLAEVAEEYLVYRISQSMEMPNWARIPGLFDARNDVLNAAINEGKESEKYRREVAAFKTAVTRNVDLVRSDRVRIIIGMERDVDEIMSGAPIELHEDQDPDVVLASMVAKGPSIEEARKIELETL
jgi:hypothetical protein